MLDWANEVYGLDQTAAGDERSEHRHAVGKEDEDDVPDLENSLAFLDHDRMQQGGPGQPRHQGRVLHRVPGPVAAPTEFDVGPLSSQKEAGAQKRPGNEQPTAHGSQPVAVEVAGHQGGERKGERNRHADHTRVQHGRMDRHVGMLKNRVEAVAVSRRKGQSPEGIGGVQIQQDEEETVPRQNSGYVGHQVAMAIPIDEQHGRHVDGDHPPPEHHRAVLPAPQRSDHVGGRHRPVRVLGDVLDGEIGGENGVPQTHNGDSEQDENRQSGVFPAANESFLISAGADNRGEHGVPRRYQRQAQGKVADVDHIRGSDVAGVGWSC